MKAFITGINGFVGKYLTEFLLSKDYEVSGIDIADTFENKNVKYLKADILDSSRIKKIISEIKPDYIFHLAGFSSVKKSFEEPEVCRKINVEGTKNVLDSALNSKILIVSSADVYGNPTSIPTKETDKLNALSPYAKSRVEQEELCKKYRKVVISRSFNHIGPGQSSVFVSSDFAKQIAEIEKGLKEPVIKVGNLSAKRDFTDVRDIVKAYLLALEKCEAGEIYNICSGNAYSIKEILDKLLSLSSIKIKIREDTIRIRQNDIPMLQGDCSKFKKITGWSPKIGIDKTLKDILEYWRKKT